MNPVVVSVFSCEVIFVYGEVWGRVQKGFKADVTDVIEVEYNVRCEKKLGHMFSKWPGLKHPAEENSKSTCVVSEKKENKCPVYFVLDFGGRTFAAVKCCLKKVNRRIRGRRPSCGLNNYFLYCNFDEKNQNFGHLIIKEKICTSTFRITLYFSLH